MFLLIIVFLLVRIRIPILGIDYKMLLGAFFFYYGFILKSYNSVIERTKIIIYILTILVTPIVALKSPSSMLTIEISNAITYVISAILLSTSLFFCFETIEQKCKRRVGWLNYTGQHTLVILTWHFLLFKLVSLLIVSLYGLPIEQIACFPTIQDYSRQGWWLAYTLVGVILPIACIYLINNIKYLRKIAKSN